MKVNVHVTEKCNFHCRQCYAKFEEHLVPTTEEWMRIIDNCHASGIVNAYNFAGGEPLLYKGLNKLIKYAYSKGAAVSIITNGYLINDAWIEENAMYLDTIGFSVDSFQRDTLKDIGRCTCSGKILEVERLVDIIRKLKAVNPKLRIKINSVVSSLNKNEDLASDIIGYDLPVSRWKLLRMCPFKNDEFDNYDLAVSDMEYQEFVNRNTSILNAVKSSEMIYTCDRGTEIVAEDRINGGYIMIDAGGYLVDDTLNTNYTRIIDCRTEDFLTGIERLNLDKELYESRYSKK